MKNEPRKLEDPAYYLTFFKLEGHQTWRAHLGSHKDAFEVEQKNWSGKGPKITERMVLRFDRLTGAFKQI